MKKTGTGYQIKTKLGKIPQTDEKGSIEEYGNGEMSSNNAYPKNCKKVQNIKAIRRDHTLEKKKKEPNPSSKKKGISQLTQRRFKIP